MYLAHADVDDFMVYLQIDSALRSAANRGKAPMIQLMYKNQAQGFPDHQINQSFAIAKRRMCGWPWRRHIHTFAMAEASPLLAW